MEKETPKVNKKILLFILIVGCFLSTLNQTLLNVALSNFMNTFDVSAATVQWLSTGFMLVNGVLVPITAFLMKRFTTRQLFISSMLFLLIGTAICAVAPNFTLLLIGRMTQAVGAGIIMPLMMSVILIIFPMEKRGSAMGLIGFAMIFAPAIAPTLAGFIIEYVSWRWLFIGFGFILYGFSSAGNKGWDAPVVIVSLLVGVVFTVLFCVRQVKADDPLLNLSVFKYKVFTLTSIINVFVTMIMYADMILLPIYLQNGRGFTAFEAGLLLLPGSVVNAMLSPVTGKLYDRIGAKPLFIIGMLFIVPSMWAVTDLTTSTSFTYLMVRTIVLRIGLSFITMPLNTAGLNALPRQLGTHGSAVNNTMRQISGAIGTAVVITVYTAQATSHATDIAHASPQQMASLASVFGSSDAYYFVTILAVFTLLLTFFVPKKKVVKTETVSTEQ